MINIVLKKGTTLGTSGGITVGGSTSEDFNASGNLNFQRGKMTVFTNYGFRREARNSSSYNFRENRYLDPLSFLELRREHRGLRNVALRPLDAHGLGPAQEIGEADVGHGQVERDDSDRTDLERERARGPHGNRGQDSTVNQQRTQLATAKTKQHSAGHVNTEQHRHRH